MPGENPIVKREKQKSTLKVLLLGAGESGKSTLCRHIRFLYGEKMLEEELNAFKAQIQRSSLLYFTALLKCVALSTAVSLEWDAEANEFITMIRILEQEDAELWKLALKIWSTKEVQEALRDPGKLTMNKDGSDILTFQQDDPATAFLPCLDRILSKGYVPTETDIISCRVATKGKLNPVLFIIYFMRNDLTFDHQGIHETLLEERNFKLNLIDVGGQRSERRKWLHYFDDAAAVIFVVAISEYDQLTVEEPSNNRMLESLHLFDSICHLKWFLKCGIVLFFNKIDVFRDKLQTTPISVCFPRYTGSQDYCDSRTYISQVFASCNCFHTRNLYIHYTCAKDRSNVEAVFSACKDTLFQENWNTVALF